MISEEYFETMLKVEHMALRMENRSQDYIEGFMRGSEKILEIFIDALDIDAAERKAELAEKLKSSDLRVISGGTE